MEIEVTLVAVSEETRRGGYGVGTDVFSGPLVPVGQGHLTRRPDVSVQVELTQEQTIAAIDHLAVLGSLPTVLVPSTSFRHFDAFRLVERLVEASKPHDIVRPR